MAHIALFITGLLLLPSISLNATVDDKPLNILFFGNSYTFYNDLPTLVGQVAVADKQSKPLIVADTAGGKNFAFHQGEAENHPENNVAHPLIDGKQWDFVVLQGYSLEATTERAPDAFPQNALSLVQAIRNQPSGYASDVTTILYQTWSRAPGHDLYPSAFETPEAMHTQIAANYQLGCATINQAIGADTARLAPVGDAFADRAFERALYFKDIHHPSASGSLLAALIIYQTIYSEDVGDIAYESVADWAKVDEVTWNSLQATAAKFEPVIQAEAE